MAADVLWVLSVLLLVAAVVVQLRRPRHSFVISGVGFDYMEVGIVLDGRNEPMRLTTTELHSFAVGDEIETRR